MAYILSAHDISIVYRSVGSLLLTCSAPSLSCFGGLGGTGGEFLDTYSKGHLR